MISEPNEKRRKPRKTVSFAASDQYYAIEYQEPILVDGGCDYPANNDIESMISGDETSTSHVSFDALDKLSAGTAFDTTTFNAFPRRLSVESTGPAGFSMDDVIQKLLNIQASAAANKLSISLSDSTVNGSADNADHHRGASRGNELEDNDEAMSPIDSTPLLYDRPSSKTQRVTLDSIIGTPSSASFNHRHDRAQESISNVTNDAMKDGVKSPNLRSELPTSSGTDSNGTVGLPPELFAELAATPKRASYSEFPLSSIDAEKNLVGIERESNTPRTAPLTVSSSAKEGLASSFNLGYIDRTPQVQTSIGQLQLVSAAQFRRRERMHRHESVAIDMARGVENYCKWKLLYNCLLLWLFAPALICSIAYGIIPYDYFVSIADNNDGSDQAQMTVQYSVWAVTLVPWILIMSAAASFSVEIYSSVISQVEFGIVIWDESPADYIRTGLVAIGASMSVQVLIFETLGAAHLGSWLGILGAGFFAISTALCTMFIKSWWSQVYVPASSCVARAIFGNYLLGLFLLLPVGSIAYTVFAILYAQFSSTSNHATGYLLTFTFPFMRLFLTYVVECCPCVRWGGQRDGLCAVYIVAIVTCLWHGVFGCLIIATCTMRGQYVVWAIVELIIQISYTMEVLMLPACSPSSIALSELSIIAISKAKYKHDNRSVLQSQSSSILKSKSSVSPDSPCDRSSLRIEKVMKERANSIWSTESRSIRRGQAMRQASFSWTRSTSYTSYASSSNGSWRVTHPRSSLFSSIKRRRLRTPEDDSRELHVTTWLCLTWITGMLTPLAFLICAAVFSIGLNKRLFASEILRENRTNELIVMAGTSDWEMRSALHRIWSINVFDKSGPSSVVYSLVAVSLYHCILMFIGSSLLSNCSLWHRIDKSERYREDERAAEIEAGRSNDDHTPNTMTGVCGDIWGLVSVLLEYHFNTIALSTITTMAVVFSVVFPWYGMNSSF